MIKFTPKLSVCAVLEARGVISIHPLIGSGRTDKECVQ